jgi:predicted Zn-dependent peptidase
MLPERDTQNVNNLARLLFCLGIVFQGMFVVVEKPLNAEVPSLPDIPFSFQVFPNGLQLVVLQEPEAHLGVVTCLFRAGGRHLPMADRGIPHLLEHLYYATPDSASQTFTNYMQQALGTGCQYQGWTAWSYTCYSSIVPSDILPWLIALEGWRFSYLHERFPLRLAAEREVLVAEIWEKGNDLPELIGLGLQVGSDPVDLSCVDSLVDPRAITLAKLEQVRRNFYTSHRTTIVVAGPVSPSAVASWVADAFGELASAPHPFPPSLRPAGLGLTPIRVASPHFNGQFILSWPAPERFSPEHPAYLVSEYLLRKAPELASRLGTSPCHQELLSDNLILDMQEDSGLHFLWGRPVPGASAEKIVEQYAKLLTALASEGPTLAELSAARAQWQRDAWTQFQTTEGRSKLLGFGAAFAGDPAAWQREWAAVSNVSASDVQAYIRNWLAPAQATFLVFVASETLPATAAALAEPVSGSILPCQSAEISSPSANLAFTLPPPNPGTASLKIPRHERFFADNGLEIWILEDQYAFAGQAQLIFPRGHVPIPKGMPERQSL